MVISAVKNPDSHRLTDQALINRAADNHFTYGNIIQA